MKQTGDQKQKKSKKPKREKWPGKCGGCGKKKKNRCDDGWCKKCHKSCSWKDCISGEWDARMKSMVSLNNPKILMETIDEFRS